MNARNDTNATNALNAKTTKPAPRWPRRVWWPLMLVGAMGTAGCGSDDGTTGSGPGEAGGPGGIRDVGQRIEGDAVRSGAADAATDSGGERDLGAAPDAAADTGPTADAGRRPDAGADADTASPCPLNSGWPCPCSGVNVCDNGDICFGIGAGEGLCSRRCAGAGDDAPCVGTMGWGIQGGGRCAYEVTYEGQTFGVCALICQVQAGDGELVKGSCPPGARCVPQDGFSACFADPSAR